MNKKEIIARAPGRINLIGEHTDYNLGYVFPAAINNYTETKVWLNDHPTRCNIVSETIGKSFSLDLNHIRPGEITWQNYIKGVIRQFTKIRKLKGFDCIIRSTIPLGSGMSSSAALTCSLATALNVLFGLNLNPYEVAKMCQRADHEFVGIMSGIMDQFTSLHGKKDHFILLDCESLEFSYHKLLPSNYSFILINTNVSHELANSEYNKRQKECQIGLQILKRHIQFKDNFKDFTIEDLNSVKDQLESNIYQRCAFVIKENDRVLETLNALENNDLKKVGQLLYRSHNGLKHEYEVSCPELDYLVDQTKSFNEVLGARMMGGGFGGCTINLIDQIHSRSVIGELKEQYFKAFGIRLDYYEVSIEDGAQILA